MNVVPLRKPPSHGGGEPEKFEEFGNWKVPINATWVLDFAVCDDRYVYTGSKRQIRELFWEIFKHDLVYLIDRPRPVSGWGEGWKISPISDFLLLGFGPLLWEERAEAITAARRTKEHGPEQVPDIGLVIRDRIAHWYQDLGLQAPTQAFFGYQRRESDVWDEEFVPPWVKCQTFCGAAKNATFHKPKLVN